MASQMQEIRDTCSEYDLPEAVQEQIVSVVNTLDRYYGTDRDMESDGGFIALLVNSDTDNIEHEYDGILQTYHAEKEECEFSDILYKDENGEYRSDLYIVSSDFGITMIWYREEGV